MSWSYGAVHEKGLILKENDFKKLLKLSNSFKEKYELDNDDIDSMYGGDLQDYAYDFDIYDCRCVQSRGTLSAILQLVNISLDFIVVKSERKFIIFHMSYLLPP